MNHISDKKKLKTSIITKTCLKTFLEFQLLSYYLKLILYSIYQLQIYFSNQLIIYELN
jgi:hypothetical protein